MTVSIDFTDQKCVQYCATCIAPGGTRGPGDAFQVLMSHLNVLQFILSEFISIFLIQLLKYAPIVTQVQPV